MPNDGPGYSPDGQRIYFNSELVARQPGHAQIFRMRTDGTGIEQLTFDERVNRFPYCLPNGKLVGYLSCPEDTTGHPPAKDLLFRLISRQAASNVPWQPSSVAKGQ